MKNIDVGFLFDKSNPWLKKFINKKTIKGKKYNLFFDINSRNEKKFHFLFILGYTKILDKNFLKRNVFNLIVHESSLPKGKGFSPVQWQILEGKNEIPVSLIVASKKVDSGDIILKSTIKLKGTELLSEIREAQAMKSIELINKFLDNFPNIKLEKQKGISTYYRKRTDNDNKLNISKTLLSQINILRVSDNEKYPAHFIYKKKKYYLKIFKD